MDNNILMIILVGFVFGYFTSSMMKQICGTILLEGSLNIFGPPGIRETTRVGTEPPSTRVTTQPTETPINPA